ncbi:hypothetical protein OG819_36565 [Streptomyces sp. NBC_01549]|uniref:hypothetical protein n=1 Tax=Streptomyces sp. NBC_01549 TaxID=2975874 RepID=UPI0022589FBD|nr:hypothetical protein [Streptomyces sp. NBC_01549]MCX4595000.1 hypothetical protein [Streptomyces sp. NBC_01549]
MSWDNNGLRAGFVVPPMPSAPPRAPADGLRAAAVALLNLCGLGLGYALVRRWGLMALCWVATAILLFVALPADPDGVPGGAVVTYLIFLGLAAVHGAVVGLRTRLVWPPRAWLASALGVVLLAVPAGGVVLYDGARDEATEAMLIDRLERADKLVQTAGKQPFATAEADYRRSLAVYRGLRNDHPDSRAAARVPDRLKTYYATVGSPYAQKNYCDAIAPLKYLRTVPRTMGKQALGALSTWPDDRLATSLYECASQSLSGGEADWTTHFSDLLSTFPRSASAAKVEPAVKAEVDKAVHQVGGGDPCAAVQRLDSLGTQVAALPGEQAGVAAALDKDADRANTTADSGTYACGVDQYKDGNFDEAITTMDGFVKNNPHHKNRARAQKIAIAAEIAQTVPAAGKRLPTTASGGSISVTVKNDSPDDITVMYTGPVTGSFPLKACGSCTSYSLSSTLVPGFTPCHDSGKSYPQRTIQLPAGTTYFVHKARSGTGKSPASDTAKLRSGYIYTECAYTTSFGY